MTGTIFRIERFAIHDGPGIRTTVFLKGCPLRCSWCHSPESQSVAPQFMPLVERCISCGTCVAACPRHAVAFPGAAPRADLCDLCATCADRCPTGARVIAGREMSVAALMGTIERDRLFYDESRGGVTLSGGEPLMQPAFVEALVGECRSRRIHVAVDTSGFGDSTALDRIRPDLFLFDIKAVDAGRHREITGVSNEVILKNLRRLADRRRQSERPSVRELERQTLGRSDVGHSGIGRSDAAAFDLVVRFPLVPRVTDTDDNVRDIGRLVSSFGIDRVDVLPYHRAGIAKYERLGRPYALPATQPPPPERVAQVVEMLADYGLTVRAGG